jgi:pyruvate formate lyase activating enzyme
MKVGGLQKLSLIDYPGKTCAVIFTQGCNFRCVYCHNPELVYPDRFSCPIPFERIHEFLEANAGLLEGVVFSGGEPTMQKDIVEKIREVCSIGYPVKLDTNGSNPDILASALPYLDYVAMDIKAPAGDKYAHVCGVQVNDNDICTSIRLIKASGIRHEFRTTFEKNLLKNTDIAEIRKLVGDSKYNLQKCSDSQK